jgi:hypothetical protein
MPNDDYEVTIVVSRGLSEPIRSFQMSVTVAIFLEPLDSHRFARY